MSLKLEIYEYIKKNGLVHGGRIEDLARSLGYMSSNASRRCRELVNEGKLAVVYDKKRMAQYTLIVEEKGWWKEKRYLSKPKQVLSKLF